MPLYLTASFLLYLDIMQRQVRFSQITQIYRFSRRRTMATTKVDSSTISKITESEKKITNQDEPVADGPTAKAQQHVGERISGQVISDITEGEKQISGSDKPMPGGPTATAQSLHTKNKSDEADTQNRGVMTSSVLHKITEKEKNITGSADDVVTGGPTAMAQKHANQKIDSNVLHDVTEGEKKITGEDGPVPGGPTATAQSELAKGRK